VGDVHPSLPDIACNTTWLRENPADSAAGTCAGRCFQSNLHAPITLPSLASQRLGDTLVNGRREESTRAGGQSAGEFGCQLRAASTTGKAWVECFWRSA